MLTEHFHPSSCSLSKGNSIHLLKDAAKKRRSKDQIAAEKAEKEEQAKEFEAMKLALRQLEAEKEARD